MAVVTLSYRTILLLFIGKALLLCLISISFQFIAIHRLDETHHQNEQHPSTSGSGSSTNTLLLRGLKATTTTTSTTPAAAATTTTTRRHPAAVIAYVVTITGCGDNDKRYSHEQAMGLIHQGAAVLRHSIFLAHNMKSKQQQQQRRYDFQMYALVHPSAKSCSSSLSKLGYTTLIRNIPFEKNDIRGQYLREHIDGASCCGAKEYLKLYAYTLVQHPIAVVLDLDSLILQPLDDLYDALLLFDDDDEHETTNSSVKSMLLPATLPIHDPNYNNNHNYTTNTNNNNNVTIQPPPPTSKSKTTTMNMMMTKNVSAFFTRDYNMVSIGKEKYAGVQGGFLMVKPNEEVFAVSFYTRTIVWKLEKYIYMFVS
jgi:hypothetical protein